MEEECDDKNMVGDPEDETTSDGCFWDMTEDAAWLCLHDGMNTTYLCELKCGTGIYEGTIKDPECDDSNRLWDDGCSPYCEVEKGF